MSVNPGLKLYFDRLVWYTRFLGSRALGGRDVDQRGFCGAVNFVFGPESDAAWHCVLSETGFRFHKGPHVAPLGTVRLDAETFLKLLAGHASYATCQMTGKVRIEGDGHCAFILSSMILQTRARARRKGPGGWLTRWMLRRALRRSGTGYELKL
jgi:hypothetical protein